MKILGWVLLVVGLIALWYSWSSGSGITAYVISLVVAGAGLWLALRSENGGTIM